MIEKTKYKDPEVKLVNMFDERINAWKISRPYLKDDEINLSDIERMDLAVSGACSYELYFRSSIFFRDLLFSIRPAVGVWARSQRTIPFDTDNLFLSGEYKGLNDEYLQDKMRLVYEDLSKGIPQDYAKKKLPMACSTEYSINMDDRTLIAFLKTLRIHCKSLYDVYGLRILNAIGRDDSYVVNRNCKDIFDKLKVSKSEYDAVGTTETHMEMFMGSFRMSNNLMAQFIRQHYSTVKNELYNKIDGKKIIDIADEMCNDESVVVLYADRKSFEKVISVRSCWFAQMDKEDNSSWSMIIGPYVDKLSPEEFLSMLPCGGDCNKCGIYKDMEARRDCIEVNFLCPVLSEKPDLVNKRVKKYSSDSRVMKKWKEVSDTGLINDNPENKDRIIYEKAIQSKRGNPEWDIFFK